MALNSSADDFAYIQELYRLAFLTQSERVRALLEDTIRIEFIELQARLDSEREDY